jgi:hypothetical protein
MAAASRKRKQQLPDWIRLHKPRKDVASAPIDVKDEEAFLRHRSAMETSELLDQSLELALATLSQPFHREVAAMLDANKPYPEEDPVSKKQRFSHETIEYDARVLPVLILTAPTYALDRHQWMKHLVTEQTKLRERTCVVWLRSTHDISYQDELLRQCLVKEPELASIMKHKKLSALTTLDLLLLWVSRTTTFDEILVFLEYTNQMQTFLQWMAERRACDDVPLTVVLYASSSRVPLRSRTHNFVGLNMRTLDLPSAEQVLDVVWEKLYDELEFPIIVPDEVMLEIGNSFRQYLKSIARVLCQVKQVIAEMHLTPGSFLIGSASSSVLKSETKRMLWFLLDANSIDLTKTRNELTRQQELISFQYELQYARRKANIAMQVERLLFRSDNVVAPSAFRVAYPPPSQICKGRIKETIELLLLLRDKCSKARMQNQFQASEIDLDFVRQDDTLIAVNQLIVLLDQCTYKPDVQYCVQVGLKQWNKLISTCLDQDFVLDPSIKFSELQPRRELVAGIIKEYEWKESVGPVLGCMYELILRDNGYGSQDEWFKLFNGNYIGGKTGRELFLVFAYAVNFLKVTGLIRERRVGAKCVYDRGVIIWCSSV